MGRAERSLCDGGSEDVRRREAIATGRAAVASAVAVGSVAGLVARRVAGAFGEAGAKLDGYVEVEVLMNDPSPVYLEVIDFIVSRATPEALLEFRPSEANQRRVSDLMER